MPTNPSRDEPAPRTHGAQRFGLVLPGSPGDDVPGGPLVRRAVSWVVLLLALLVAAGLAVGALLQVNVTVTARGVIEPADVWPVRAREPGTILAVKATSGDTVTAGQPLLELDPFEHRQTIADLEARWRLRRFEYDKAEATLPIETVQQRERVAAAAAALVQARAGLRAELVERGLAPNVDSTLDHYTWESGVTLDVAVASVRAAMAEHRNQLAELQVFELAELDREREQTELDLLARQIAAERERLGRLAVAAPAPGVVLTEEVHRLLGARVQAGDLLMEVGDPLEWRATLLVPADHIHRVRLGDWVLVEIQALRGDERRRVDGVVQFIGSQPSTYDPTRPGLNAALASAAYRVQITLDSAQVADLGRDRLRMGYPVEGKIVTRSGNVLRLLWAYLREHLTR